MGGLKERRKGGMGRKEQREQWKKRKVRKFDGKKTERKEIREE